jgi:hypothetical protein
MWMSRVFGVATIVRRFSGLGEKIRCVAPLLVITLDTVDLLDKGMRKDITKAQGGNWKDAREISQTPEL